MTALATRIAKAAPAIRCVTACSPASQRLMRIRGNSRRGGNSLMSVRAIPMPCGSGMS